MRYGVFCYNGHTKTKRAELTCGGRAAAVLAPDPRSGQIKPLAGYWVWGNRAWACGLSPIGRRDKLMSCGANRRLICEVAQV